MGPVPDLSSFSFKYPTNDASNICATNHRGDVQIKTRLEWGGINAVVSLYFFEVAKTFLDPKECQKNDYTCYYIEKKWLAY